MKFPNGRLHWDVQFLRSVQDWELEPLMAFMDLIHSFPVKGEGPDALDWKPAKSQGFEVRGYYLSLYLTTGTSFPWKLV